MDGTSAAITRQHGARLLLVVVSLTVGVCGLVRHRSRLDLDPTRQAMPRGGFAVDPNHANVAELSLLPGVGPTLAQRIVEHREQAGPFDAPEDLLEVRGVGPAKLEGMTPYLTLAAPLTSPPQDDPLASTDPSTLSSTDL